MNVYETIIIFDPHVETIVIESYVDICQRFTGHEYEIKKEIIGPKRLAYDIKGHKEGYYVVLTWRGTGENVIDLERNFRINDKVLKFITVKTEVGDDEEEFERIAQSDSAAVKSEQIAQPDALDVLFGMAEYVAKKEKT